VVHWSNRWFNWFNSEKKRQISQIIKLILEKMTLNLIFSVYFHSISQTKSIKDGIGPYECCLEQCYRLEVQFLLKRNYF
jgi:hypothetical protein